MYEREAKGNPARFFHSHSDDDLGLHALVIRVYTPVSLSHRGMFECHGDYFPRPEVGESQVSNPSDRNLSPKREERKGTEPSDKARVESGREEGK